MSLAGNIIWLVFGGFLTGLGYILGGLGICLTIIGIPFGLQAVKLGIASLTPFGKEIVEVEDADSPLRLIFNIIWIVLFGWEIAIAHLVFGLILAITIIGLPFAKQHFKLLVIALLPFGRDLR
ncbi:MAG: YccF domain-containing protein [Leptolyngbyaceae cyanobacterium SM1_4_3]|nr:YccF domain-containing protein [Leptolyngbyaceae cyanobacterium SM1_4_3]NJN89239.1 YccF domain-containing protein [Leptolyngbyaceae cyanobacterium SL_5_14]